MQPLLFSLLVFFTIALSFAHFRFPRWRDFGAYRTQKICLWAVFHSNGCKFRQVRFQKIGFIYSLLF